MDVLWLAILLYSVGLAVVLHLRPALMFNANGTWKEFGYQRSSESRHTLFPFWLFAVVWAFVSYAVAAAITWSWVTTGVVASTAAHSRNWLSHDEEETDAMDMMMSPIGATTEDEFIPVSQARRPRGRPRGSTSAAKPRQGYYVLAPGSIENANSGLQRYIYYGDSPPPIGRNEGRVSASAAS